MTLPDLVKSFQPDRIPGYSSILFFGAMVAMPVFSQPDTWKEAAPAPSARSESRAVVIDGLIYFPGGFGGLYHFAAYDPATDKWKTLRNMPKNMHHHMVESFDGKLYIFKGETYEYTPATDTWEQKKSGSLMRSDGTAVAYKDHIYIFGGQNMRPIERYAPATDSWEVLSNMPTLLQNPVHGDRLIRFKVTGRSGSR